MCVSIKGAQNSKVLILQFLVVEQNPVWNNMAVHPTWKKKENNSAEKEGLLYAYLPPPSCQK